MLLYQHRVTQDLVTVIDVFNIQLIATVQGLAHEAKAQFTNRIYVKPFYQYDYVLLLVSSILY